MRKIHVIVLILITMVFAGCKSETIDCSDEQVLENGVCVEVDDSDPVVCNNGYSLVNGVCLLIIPLDPVTKETMYHTHFSGAENLNPYSEASENEIKIYDLLTDSLYRVDFDWDSAIADGLATEVGDFETSGAASLPYGRFPAMAAGEPVDVLGDGTVWEITLREDLQFEDGTVIDADTFEYSWSMLLDPDLLNARASNLYDPENISIVNAEAYFNQNSFQSDSLGFDIYELAGGVLAAREYSFSHIVTGTTWELYFPETGIYEGITFADGATALEQNIYTGYWGEGYGPDGWVMVDFEDNPFQTDTEGTLIAPSSGWTYSDGTDIAVAADAIGDIDYFGVFPAYYTDETVPARATVDTEGLPIDGTRLPNEEVLWSDVGFKIIDEYTFQITLTIPKSSWELKGILLSGDTGVVHMDSYEAGMNESKTYTTYGSIDNPLVSYGQYILIAWQNNINLSFRRNEDHYNSEAMRIKYIRYEVIDDQSVAIDEFKEGRLDAVVVDGYSFAEFKYSQYLKLSSRTAFYRLILNIEGSDNYELNPILQDVNFRKAIYYAIDREEYSLEVRGPSYPTGGFLGPAYFSSESSVSSYRGTTVGQNILADYFPEDYGYNPEKAKELFDLAYQNLVDIGTISDGDIVSVEYKYYYIESGYNPYIWFKDTIEAILNEGEEQQKFELKLTSVSASALDLALENGDFEIAFGGWQGLQFDAPSMLGQVYNSSNDYMVEKGFDTANAIVEVVLPKTKVALEDWVVEYEELTITTNIQDASYDEWIDMLSYFDGNTISCTYDELYIFASSALYNINDLDYAGKAEEFDIITGALEGVLLDQMIAIPLFSSVSAMMYSNRVFFEINEYNPYISFDDLRYIYLTTTK